MSSERLSRIITRLRPHAFNAGLVALSLVGALLLAEGLVRLLAPQQLILIRPDLWQAADTLGWVHRPHVETLINTGERTVHVYTDQDGFRVGEKGRREGRKRVLILGDSFMEALQVEYEQSLAGLLEQRLSERLGEAVAVRNAAVGGWGPNHYLLRARSLLGRDTFDLVVVSLFVEDDVGNRHIERFPSRTPVERKRFRIPRSLSRRELIDATLAPINDTFEVRSHLFVLIKNRMETLRMRTGLTTAYFPRSFLRSEAESTSWAFTAELCLEIADLAAAQGARTLFVLIPTAYQVDSEVFTRYLAGFGMDSTKVDLDQPSRLLRDGLTAQKLEVVDALPALREAKSNGEQLYGNVDRHLSPEGHIVLESVVVPRAVEMLESSGESVASY